MENIIKKLEALAKLGLANREDMITLNALKENIELKKQLQSAKTVISSSFERKDFQDEKAVCDRYVTNKNDPDQPAWTEAHIKQLCNDYWLIKKPIPMTEYTKHSDYNKDIRYWSNSAGDLFDGNTGLLAYPEELPTKELRVAWNTLWTAGSGSCCYVVEYKNTAGVLLSNEFDECTAENYHISMEELYDIVCRKAKALSDLPVIANAEASVIITKDLGFDRCHEISVFIPWDTPKEKVDAIADFLDHNIYYSFGEEDT